MDDFEDNPNIEWKKVSIGEDERLTRKTNIKEAVEYEAKKDNVFKSTPPQPKNLPVGLKKIQKKVRALGEEYDEDEDEVQLVADPLFLEQNNSSLYNALHEDEKKILRQQETNNTIKQQLETEKLATITQANKMVRDAGFKGLKKNTIRQSMNENTITPKKLQQTIKKEFGAEIKKTAKEWDKMSDKDLMNLMAGVNKLKVVGGKKAAPQTIKEMDTKEIVELGKEKNNEKKVARTICEKTGRKEVKQDKNLKKEAEKALLKQKALNKKFVKDRERS